jgi:hypothetical protein
VKLGIPHQRHYETRSTFINPARAGGALLEDVYRLTHASIGEAKDLYRRIREQWPRLCRAVRAVQIARGRGRRRCPSRRVVKWKQPNASRLQPDDAAALQVRAHEFPFARRS